ncbi:dihydrodipicolinate synthase family protein [Streptomyces sp. AC536]|uniref:dihydrodipicolinate synthase family protein n=1 Tax=Streptomyces buecherae TaxID=2763006 RepID=UPI00164EAA68|nr:dihydrodipicolinate synthase family protein [Streptomyces buecherae]MBC3981217.1 dihydrodipicolinate synthase family protein [Streptomyces buecherae]QNJ42145.1 dihydrodipicolinate synthase family protein [Streptomyces buecherae]
MSTDLPTDPPTDLPEPAAAPSAAPGARSKPHARALTGVVVATALPYADDPAAPAGLRPDLDRYAEHCRWLVDSGCHGVGPNGSLGEYSSLTDTERRAVARTAVTAVGRDALVVVGVHGVGAHQARRWAEHAAEDGADGVLCLPPTLYRASTAEVVHHFEQVAAVGLPVMVYNNPLDTKVDLTPEVIGELAAIDNVVAVKEFSGDVRRVRHIKECAPDLAMIAGADDLVLESLLMGAEGWFAGFPNVFPAASVRLFDLARAGRLAEARALYEPLVAAFRWDSRTEFVQAIKRAMDLVGRYGGPSRPPRGPLAGDQLAALDADVRRAVDALAAADAEAAPRPGEPVAAGARQPAAPAVGVRAAGGR